MQRWLIVYSSREGQAARIAAHIARELDDDFLDVTLRNVTKVQPADLEGIHGIVIGASVHMGHHARRVAKFVKDNLETLKKLRSGFFSVSLSAASRNPARRGDADVMAADLLADCGWDPDVIGVFAGAVKFSEYGPIRRLLVSRIARRKQAEIDPSSDQELTDWQVVHDFVRKLTASR